MRLQLFFLFITLFPGTYFSQEVFPFPMQESSLLWKIEGNGLKKDVYLFGTMHLIEKDYFIFPEKLQKTIAKSDLLVMELGEMPDPSESIRLMTLKSGTFFDFFTPEQTDSVLNWVKKNLFMDSATFSNQLGKFKPFAIVQLATQMQFLNNSESYELKFYAIAEENKIPVLGLETIEEQLAIFDQMSDQEQAELVMNSIRNPEKSAEELVNLEKIYATQQIDSLYMQVTSEMSNQNEEEEKLLISRNKAWIPQLNSLPGNKRIFIAVGAGHLGGPTGLIRLLQQQGYTLKPISL